MLGKPVRMRITPNTAKPGSILVSRTTGASEVDVSVGVAVGEIVNVTLNTVGNTVVIVTSWSPDLVTAVVVKLVETIAVVRSGVDEVGVVSD